MFRALAVLGVAAALIVLVHLGMAWFVPGLLVGLVAGYYLGRTRAEWGRAWDDARRDWNRRHSHRRG